MLHCWFNLDHSSIPYFIFCVNEIIHLLKYQNFYCITFKISWNIYTQFNKCDCVWKLNWCTQQWVFGILCNRYILHGGRRSTAENHKIISAELHGNEQASTISTEKNPKQYFSFTHIPWNSFAEWCFFYSC